MAFSNDLDATYHEEKDQWEINSPMIYISKKGWVIAVPKGIFTDLASTHNVPFFPQDGTYNQAAVLHDFLYQGEFLPRGVMDDIFKEALESIREVPRWKIPVMWVAVRMFGGFTYSEHNAGTVRNARMLAGVADNGNRPLWKDGIPKFNMVE